MSDDFLCLVGANAQTPVDRYVPAAAAAVLCGISAYAEHPFMIDQHGEPMALARADSPDESLPLAAQVPVLLRQMRVRLALSAENLPDSTQRQTVLDRVASGTEFNGGTTHHRGQLHTVIIEPDERRLIMVWQTGLLCYHTLYILKETLVVEKLRVSIGAQEDPEPKSAV